MAAAEQQPQLAEPQKKTEEGIDLGVLIDWVNEADAATQSSREMSEKCRNFYDSKQWSEAEARALRKRKQAPVVINRIKPKVDGLMGMERSNRTTAKAYPRTPQHTNGAEAATQAIRFVMDDQFYRQTRSAAFDNLCVEGSCGIEVIVKDKPYGICIEVNHIMWDRLIYDPHSRRKDFGDARYKGQVIWLDYDIAADRFPDKKEMLETMVSGSTTYDDKPRWIDSKRRRVKIVELYYMEGSDWHYVCFTRGGYLKEPMKSSYVNEDGETEDAYEFASLFVDMEGNRYGATLQYLDVQEEINKRRSKALHLMSVRQVRLERGAVEDINVARSELAKPDGVLETTPGMEFEVLKTGDMAAAQFNLLTEAKQEIDAVGYNAAASGKDTRSMSGIALQNREAAAQTELSPMFDVLKHLDVRVYRKIWNRIRQYWTAEKWIRVTDDPSTVRFVGLNYKTTRGEALLDQAKTQKMPQDQYAALQTQVGSDPSYNESVTMNQVDQLDVDIVIDDAPDSVTVQQEEFTAMAEMVKSGVPIPPTAIVEASSLKNKEKILQEMRAGVQLPPEIQDRMKQMQEQGQKLAQENQQLKMDHSADHAKIQAGAQADAAKIAQQREAKMAELQLMRETNAEEAKLAREKAEAEMALRAWQAEQESMLAHKQLETQALLKDKEQTTSAAQNEKKMAMDGAARQRELEMKSAEQAKADEATAMPNFMKAMEAMMKAMQQIVETNAKAATQQAQAMQAIAQSMSKPKTVSLDGIQRNQDGMLTGGSATVQ